MSVKCARRNATESLALPDSRTCRTILHIPFIFAAGWLLSRLGFPLPWMAGPLIVTSGISLAGISVRIPKIIRPAGQLIVAAAIGATFSTHAFWRSVELAGIMVAGAVLTTLAGVFAAIILMRVARTGAVQAYLSCMPVGPAETAVLAEHYRIPPGPPVFAQTMRIALMVLSIPPIVLAMQGVTPVPAGAAIYHGNYPGSLLLICVALAGTVVFRLIRIVGPVFLGSLAFTAAATATDLPVAPLPYSCIVLGQVFLGTALGASFDRDMFMRAPRFLFLCIFSTIALLFMCAGFAAGLSFFVDLPWTILVLGMAPGSVTEMSLTAKLLRLDVATVAAFHIVRMMIVQPLTPLMLKCFRSIATSPDEKALALRENDSNRRK